MSSFWIWLKADTLPSLKWLKHFVTAIGYLSDRAIFLQRSKVHIERDNVWLLLQYKANIIHLFTTTNLGACWWGSPDRDVAQDQVIRDVDILSKSNDEKKLIHRGVGIAQWIRLCLTSCIHSSIIKHTIPICFF